jgi:hypothetical protein
MSGDLIIAWLMIGGVVFATLGQRSECPTWRQSLLIAALSLLWPISGLLWIVSLLTAFLRVRTRRES